MCKFFSAVSNGKGKVLFFKIEDIKKIEKDGNKENYNWNSHTSILHYNGIKGDKEDKWNKWEYNTETKELKLDGKLKTKHNDKEDVFNVVQNYLKIQGEIYCYKIYKNNSGDRNSGSDNSGNGNSGDRNSGSDNSGNGNSGNDNSGNCNSGYRNSGDGNSGDRNSGDRNSGYRNSGDRNSGDGNSGDRNSGYKNSGSWNSGNCNSGFFNTDEPNIRMFNKETNLKESEINIPLWMYFDLAYWIEDKTKIEGGYLKKYNYKEAFRKAFYEADILGIKQTLELPNFDYDIFEEISGISKEMIEKRLQK